jgi:hypothetical protein
MKPFDGVRRLPGIPPSIVKVEASWDAWWDRAFSLTGCA